MNAPRRFPRPCRSSSPALCHQVIVPQLLEGLAEPSNGITSLFKYIIKSTFATVGCDNGCFLECLYFFSCS
uniref:Uncharacterized protein n=1 Tax=Pararge aegeria TaxID=116150 RepID=S4P0G3_9NEOP